MGRLIAVLCAALLPFPAFATGYNPALDSVIYNGSTSGTVTVLAPATAGTNTVTWAAKSGTPALVLAATSTAIGGGSLAAGACASTTVTVTGATTAMVIDVTPVTFPGAGFFWKAYVSASNTVTVEVCASVVGTPTSSAYNVRVIQ
jgi:hypothetical protein